MCINLIRRRGAAGDRLANLRFIQPIAHANDHQNDRTLATGESSPTCEWLSISSRGRAMPA